MAVIGVELMQTFCLSGLIAGFGEDSYQDVECFYISENELLFLA